MRRLLRGVGLCLTQACDRVGESAELLCELQQLPRLRRQRDAYGGQGHGGGAQPTTGRRPDVRCGVRAAAGDNPDRLHTEQAFAALCGASPIPASSGKTRRYRLNRSGDRQANADLWRIMIADSRSSAVRRLLVVWVRQHHVQPWIGEQ